MDTGFSAFDGWDVGSPTRKRKGTKEHSVLPLQGKTLCVTPLTVAFLHMVIEFLSYATRLLS